MKIKLLPITVTFLFLIFFLVFFLGLKNPNIYKPNINEKKEIPFFTAKLFNSTTSINSNEIFVGKNFYCKNGDIDSKTDTQICQYMEKAHALGLDWAM